MSIFQFIHRLVECVLQPLKIWMKKPYDFFAISKLSWIKKQRKEFDTQERQSVRAFLSGESHYFMGTRYLLNVIESNEKQRVELRNKIVHGSLC